MPKKKIDTSLLDKAIIFATNAHKGIERNGKGFPYIVHPLEAVSIAAMITSDQEILAAAALHDVMEDAGVSYETLAKEFSPRVADLVKDESDEPTGGDASITWKDRKVKALKRLQTVSYDEKIVTISDKLSNLRAMYRDYLEIGDKLWLRFHEKDPKQHAWRYKALRDALSELHNTPPFIEFSYIIDKLFGNIDVDFSVNIAENGYEVFISGALNYENSRQLEAMLLPNRKYLLDFLHVTGINYAGQRTLLRLMHNGTNLYIRNVNRAIKETFDVTGVSKIIPMVEKPVEIDMSHLTPFGDGYTAVSYNSSDNDSIVKVYQEFVKRDLAEREKLCAMEVLFMDIPTPLSGPVIKIGNKNGVVFERVMDKLSLARKLSRHPDDVDEISKQFADLAKKLHSTTCTSKSFYDVKEFCYKSVKEAPLALLSEDEKIKVNEFIKNVPDVRTCVHGDFHIGNVIETPSHDLMFIDLSDFAYGHPYFDIGTFYFVTHQTDEEYCMRIFHCSCELLLKCWESFAKYYFGADTEAKLNEVEEMIKPYAAIKVLNYSIRNGVHPWMVMVIQDWLIPYCK